jgi:SAM domain (Sterile alpha motif)
VSTPATEISDWLSKLGMSEYAERFSENKIDVSVLRHLTDQDIKDIGVPLGHRRRGTSRADECQPSELRSLASMGVIRPHPPQEWL